MKACVKCNRWKPIIFQGDPKHHLLMLPYKGKKGEHTLRNVRPEDEKKWS